MKVIDLLNKIAKGELKEYITFEYYGTIYDFDSFWEDFPFTEQILNEMVVVIEKEEDKKIEKIETKIGYGGLTYLEDEDFGNGDIGFTYREDVIISKINEIIDKLNNLEK